MRFVGGVILFFVGMYVNLESDHILRSRRSDSRRTTANATTTPQYKIPYGGMFQYVSTPHFFGEICEWVGFAIAANSRGAFAFCLYTASNLIPRGEDHHRWYLQHFRDYPRERMAIIPFIW